MSSGNARAPLTAIERYALAISGTGQFTTFFGPRYDGEVGFDAAFEAAIAFPHLEQNGVRELSKVPQRLQNGKVSSLLKRRLERAV